MRNLLFVGMLIVETWGGERERDQERERERESMHNIMCVCTLYVLATDKCGVCVLPKGMQYQFVWSFLE